MLAEDFNTGAELGQLDTFRREHEAELGNAAAAVEQRLESTRANILWVETHYTTLLDWLAQHGAAVLNYVDNLENCCNFNH